MAKRAIAIVMLSAFFLTCSMAVKGQGPGGATGKTGVAAPETRVLLGPNILVSRDGDFAHVEMMVAANPHKVSELLAGSIVFARPEGGVDTRSYISQDGGFRWEETSQPAPSGVLGADPQVAYGISGTAYFMSLALPDPEAAATQPPKLLLSRSSDGGRTWGQPTTLGDLPYDHPQIAVDQSYGRFAGRVYVGVLGGGKYPEYIVGVFRSDDDGRSFIGPVRAANGGGKRGINVENLMVLSDGTLVVPYCDFSINDSEQHGIDPRKCWSVISRDGAVSFSSPRVLGTLPTSLDEPHLSTFPQFVADATGSQYKDRLYGIWNEFRNGRSKVMFSYSSDQGVTWNTPSPIDRAAPEAAIQFQPAIAVNKDGVVGVIWSDTRGLPDEDYNVYFTASEDGGNSFLPSIKLTDEVSHRTGAGNKRMTPATWKLEQESSARMTFLSPMLRWPVGGDYAGLAADVEGTFHPLWPDSRSGTYQIYTTQVKLEHAKPASGSAATSAACPAVRTDVTGDVTLLNDPTKFVADKREADLPIRLKNNSKQPIYSPIVVEIDGFGSGMGDMWKEYAPTIVNASNNKRGSGATFDYSTLLGSFDFLAPGGETGAFTWKLQLSSRDVIPDFHYRVFGKRPVNNCQREAKPGAE